MAKKAFLLGCNSDGLKHCQKDAALIKKALIQCGYKDDNITLINDWSQQQPSLELQQYLQKFSKDCTEADTVVFYFAGHSLSDGKEFYFILADDINQPENQLWADIVLHLLERCRAADKVLIFDCCRSGKTSTDYDWHSAAGEWCRIFTATSSKETAMEIDKDTGGGLFTSWIYRALTSEVAKLADIDGYLRINRLDDRIQELAKNYRSPGGRTAPVPRLYGSTDKKIALTEKITALSNPTTGYPPSFITELKSLLAFQQLSTEQLQQCVKYCCAWSDPPIPYPAAHSGDLNLILDNLAILYYRAGNRLPLPLVSFVAYLNEMLGNPPWLTAWLDRLTEWLGNAAITPQHLADARRDKSPATSEQTPYLMVEIEPLRNSSRYYVHLYWQNTQEEQWPLPVDDEAIGLSAVPQIVINELNKNIDPHPYLEFILPKALLTDNETLRSWEQWAIDSNERSRPLGVEYPISLRCRERLREVERHKKCGYDHLVGYWKRYHTCFSKPPVLRCADWLTIDNIKNYIDYVQSPDLFFGLLFSPERSYLGELLNAGAAIVLWPRQENLSAPMQELLDRYFSQHALSELPEALRQVRENVFIKSDGAQTADLSLLWDDPNRKPGMDAGRLQFPT